MDHLTKIAADGSLLPIEAPEWSLVLIDSPVAKALSPTGKGFEFIVAETDRLSQPKAVEYCLAITGFGGGFELPSLPVLELLRDLSVCDPAIDKRFFPNCHSNWYWTSTPAASSPAGCARLVDFGNGYSGWDHRSGESRVRAVRPRQ